MPTTVTAKGQVTIPKPVRDLLGLDRAVRSIFAVPSMAAWFLFASTKRGLPAVLPDCAGTRAVDWTPKRSWR